MESMKSKPLLIILALSAVVLFGFQVLVPGRAFIVTATVDIKPETINLNREGRWITVFIALPEGYNISDIDRTNLFLKDPLDPSWHVSPEWSNIECDKLMVKFDSSLVIEHLWERLWHMGGNRNSIELTIEGSVNGTPFEGSDAVTIMDPILAEP
jgi:hypothetical protein